MATIVLGVQWGDEGKALMQTSAQEERGAGTAGTVTKTPYLASRLLSGAEQVLLLQTALAVSRPVTEIYGLPTAVVANGVTYDFHMLPSGLVNPSTTNLIGSGVVLHVPTFFSELATLEQKGLPRVRERLKVSTRCALNLDLHAVADRMREENLGAKKIGTTGQGIGPAYSAKAERSHCVIVADLFEDGGVFEDKIRTLAQVYARTFGRDLIDYDVEEEISKLKEYRSQLLPFCVDDVEFLEEAQKQNKKIMVEGAQSAMLDNTYGTYPFVTSTSTTLGGIMSGLNLNRRKIDAVVGVLKAYTTRVGAGPFPTEQPGEVGTTLRERGHEVGVTTGRPRRCGWLDLVVARYSNAVNAYDVLNVTKLDVLDTLGEIRVAVAYVHPDTRETIATFPASAGLLDRVEVVYKTMKGWNTPTTHTKTFGALPVEAREYVNFIEEFVGVKVRWIGCGPRREDIIVKED